MEHDDPSPERLEAMRRQTGLALCGASPFADTPALQEELLAAVLRGDKRATAGAADPEDDAQVGDLWGVLDSSGALHCVTETVEVRHGPLRSVTPAFAWDEGERARTRASWLDGHRAFFLRQGIQAPDDLQVCFERFRVVWPEPDAVRWWAPGVRALRFDERAWFRDAYRARWGTTERVSRGTLHDVDALPGLVFERDGVRVAALTFRPWPDHHTEVVSIDAFTPGHDPIEAFTQALRALSDHAGWARVWRMTTRDNPHALRAHQRAGWEQVARLDALELELTTPPNTAPHANEADA